MKPHLIVICIGMLLLLQPMRIFAQQPTLKDLYPFDDGKIKKPFKQAIPYSSKANFLKPDHYTNADSNYLIKARKAIYKKLADAAQGTLDSLKKPQTGLKQFYTDLYGSAAEVTLEVHLAAIIKVLTDKNPKPLPAGDDAFFACFEKIITGLKPQAYSIEGKDLPLVPAIEVDVYEDDLVKQFFSQLMSTACEGLSCIPGPNFDRDKRDLEELLRQSILIRSAYKCVDSKKNDALQDLFDKIKANPLYVQATRACVQQLFWLGGGSFKFSPFAQVTVYNWPLIDLYADIIRQKVDSIKRCCENDPVKIQALLMALKVDPNKFKGTTDKLFGYKSAKEIRQTQSFVNKILIPVVTDKDCCATGYPDLFKKKWILNYDVADKYRSDQPCLKPAIPEDEQFIITANNIGSDTTVIFTVTEKAVQYESKSLEAMGQIGSGLSSAYTAINPLAGVISSFITPQSVTLPDRVSISGSTSQSSTATTVVNAPAVALHNDITKGKGQQSEDRFGTQKTTVETTTKVQYVYLNVGDRTLTFPGANRKDVLDAVIEGMVGSDKPSLKTAEAFFLANCDETELDNLFQNTSADNLQAIEVQLQTRVKALIGNFNEFLENNRQRQEAENEQLKTYITDLNLIVNALEAQNPPDTSGQGRKGDQPVYHTTLSTFPKVDAPKQEIYVLTEETAKPVKGVPKTGEPSATDSVKVSKIHGSYKVGKYYRFQISAGLAVSTNDYVLNDAAITNNVLTSTAKDQQISFVVGLHTYPWRDFNMDNTFLGIKNKNVLEDHFLNRISVYTGVGIPDPTKNFYGGLSFDLLPGVKITGGEHFIVYTRYQLNNNYITGQQSVFRGASPFVSINLDPSFIGSVFGLFK